MTPDDVTALKRAVEALEHPSFAARLANMVGKPIELIEHALPPFAASAIATATSKALEAAMQVAVRTLQREPHAGSQGLHIRSWRQHRGLPGVRSDWRHCRLNFPSRRSSYFDPSWILRKVRAKISLTLNRCFHACKSLQWAVLPNRTTHPKADIWPSALH